MTTRDVLDKIAISSMSFKHLSNRAKTADQAHLPSKPVTDRAYKMLDTWGLGRSLRSPAVVRKFPQAVLMAFWTVVGNEAVRLGRQLTEEDIRHSFRNYYAAARIISNAWPKEENQRDAQNLNKKL